MTRPYLTPRQQQCLRLAAAGLDRRQTGRRLGIAGATVGIHLGNARAALLARNTPHAVGIAMHHGIVTAEHLELP